MHTCIFYVLPVYPCSLCAINVENFDSYLILARFGTGSKCLNLIAAENLFPKPTLVLPLSPYRKQIASEMWKIMKC